jgi:hypothetical protein
MSYTALPVPTYHNQFSWATAALRSSVPDSAATKSGRNPRTVITAAQKESLCKAFARDALPSNEHTHELSELLGITWHDHAPGPGVVPEPTGAQAEVPQW